MENRKCLHCGKDLTTGNGLHFNGFCSQRCYDDYKKCLHCGKDLTETDILQFNKFCSVECLREKIKKYVVLGFDDNAKYAWNICWRAVQDFWLVKNIQQVETNIRMLDADVQRGNSDAISLVKRGVNFVPYTIGNSTEIHTAPSRYTGYVANTPNWHCKGHAIGHRENRLGIRRYIVHGHQTEPALDRLFGGHRYDSQLCEAHKKYCYSLGIEPAPAFHTHPENTTFWPLIHLPEQP